MSRKYFDSIPHDKLVGRLERRIKDRRVLGLLGRVVGSFRGDVGRGLPIGSLTSQHLANFYLGWFDRRVKEGWQVPGYVRYMDDMVLWSDDRDELAQIETTARPWLIDELGLNLKPNPVRNRSAVGVDWLGCRVFPMHAILNRRSRVRMNRKLAGIDAALIRCDIGEFEAQARSAAVIAFARAAGGKSWRTRRSVVNRLRGSVTGLEPGDTRRVLEHHCQELSVGEPQQELAVEAEQQPGLPLGSSSTGRADA